MSKRLPKVAQRYSKVFHFASNLVRDSEKARIIRMGVLMSRAFWGSRTNFEANWDPVGSFGTSSAFFGASRGTQEVPKRHQGSL